MADTNGLRVHQAYTGWPLAAKKLKIFKIECTIKT